MADVGGVAAERLRSFIERVERLEEEKAALAADIREVFAEAKGNGFDTKIMRQVIKLRKMETNDRQEQEHLLDLYKRAVNRQLISDVPLGLLLSGGLDSGLLLAMMNLYGDSWKTFTIGFGEGFKNDELRAAASAVAAGESTPRLSAPAGGDTRPIAGSPGS